MNHTITRSILRYTKSQQFPVESVSNTMIKTIKHTKGYSQQEYSSESNQQEKSLAQYSIRKQESCTQPFTQSPLETDSHSKVESKQSSSKSDKSSHSQAKYNYDMPPPPLKKTQQQPSRLSSRQYGLINGITPEKNILEKLELFIQNDSSLSFLFTRLCEYFDKGGTFSPMWIYQREIIHTLVKELSAKIKSNGEYLIDKETKNIHQAVITELLLQHYQTREGYRQIQDDYKSFKQDKNIKTILSYLVHTQYYSSRHNIALYAILSLIQKKTGSIDDTVLALLSLNIQNQEKVKYINALKARKEKINTLQNKLTQLSKQHYIPPYTSSRYQKAILSFLHTITDCLRPQIEEGREFEMTPFCQGDIVRKNLYVSSHGLCYFLSSLHMYFFTTYGVEQGKEKLLEVLSSLTKAVQEKDSLAIQYLTGILSFNVDTNLLQNNSILIPRQHMASEDIYNRNNAQELSLQESIELIFNPNFCDEHNSFYLLELDENRQSGHASSIFREYQYNPVTNKTEFIVHFFEPNYGFIRVTDKNLFAHCLLQMDKQNHVFALQQADLSDMIKYKSRFNTHVIDILENRIIDNPMMQIEPRTDRDDIRISSYRAREYNKIGQEESILLALLHSLSYRWDTLQEIAQKHNIELPTVPLHSGLTQLTIGDIQFFYDKLESLPFGDRYYGEEDSDIAEEIYSIFESMNSISFSMTLAFRNIAEELPKEHPLHKAKEELYETLYRIIRITTKYMESQQEHYSYRM